MRQRCRLFVTVLPMGAAGAGLAQTKRLDALADQPSVPVALRLAR